MKTLNSFKTPTLYILLLLGCLCLLQTGCARSEAELHDGITDIFDTAFVPLRLFTRQADDTADALD